MAINEARDTSEDQGTDAGGATMLSKITPATIGLRPKRAAPDMENMELELAHILGEASGTQTKKAPNGDVFTALTGKFEAINLETGEIFRSGVLFLPGGAHELITNTLLDMPDANIDFAIALRAYPQKHAAGYSWKVVPLVALETADPLAKIRAKLPPQASRLAAPNKLRAISGPATIEHEAQPEAHGKRK